MKAKELNLLKLSDDINKYLPFKLDNPRIKGEKITILNLATHTAGLKKSVFDLKALYFPTNLPRKPHLKFGLKWIVYKIARLFYKKNSYLSLEQYLYKYYGPGAKWYYKWFTFNKTLPGKKWEYSNAGASFVALAIEKASGIKYYNFVRKYILDTLGMKYTKFDFEQNKDTIRKSSLYHFGTKIPNDYKLILYPAGGVESNVYDFTHFMQKVIEGYKYGNCLLTKESFRYMLNCETKPFLNQGILWRIQYNKIVGHRGDIAGATTFAYFNKDTGIGYILFCNSAGTSKIEKQCQKILKLLKNFAKQCYEQQKL
jgi:CubicO group peptidase (beta-lactamase class C family)